MWRRAPSAGTGGPSRSSADDSVVEAPPPALERAISNLIDNAAKFDPTDDPIEVDVDDGAVTVHDRGPGIPADDAPRIFDRFYRADGARTLPGSGLGLSIVRDVAVSNGGDGQRGRPAGGRRQRRPPPATRLGLIATSCPGHPVADLGRRHSDVEPMLWQVACRATVWKCRWA